MNALYTHNIKECLDQGSQPHLGSGATYNPIKYKSGPDQYNHSIITYKKQKVHVFPPSFVFLQIFTSTSEYIKFNII